MFVELVIYLLAHACMKPISTFVDAEGDSLLSIEWDQYSSPELQTSVLKHLISLREISKEKIRRLHFFDRRPGQHKLNQGTFTY